MFASADGTITLLVESGKEVAVGDELARIESPELDNRLQQERATLETAGVERDRQRITTRQLQLQSQKNVDLAEVALTAARRELRRSELAFESRAIAEIDLQKGQDDLHNAELAHEHAVKDMELDLERLNFELRTRELEVERLQGPWSGWDEGVEHTTLIPEHLLGNSTSYLIRTEPGRRDALMRQIETPLAASEDGRILRDMRTMEETRERAYEGSSSLVNILTTAIMILVAITTLGVSGLTSFNVTRRTKQIGTRRALGATRTAILRYFLAENFLFTAIGVTLGAVLGVGLNMLLVEAFSIPRFEWYLVPVAMLALLVIGQLAVLIPARRAAGVSPALATRTI